MPTSEDRFWMKADKSGGSDACWTWNAYRDKKGYGQFRVGGKSWKTQVKETNDD